MTIQEYIKIAVLGFPKKEFLDYRRFFTNMDCQWCVHNGFACKSPDEVCIHYRVDETDIKKKLGL
jgi:hypothetical protein